jgi:hypothetical protein
MILGVCLLKEALTIRFICMACIRTFFLILILYSISSADEEEAPMVEDLSRKEAAIIGFLS